MKFLKQVKTYFSTAFKRFAEFCLNNLSVLILAVTISLIGISFIPGVGAATLSAATIVSLFVLAVIMGAVTYEFMEDPSTLINFTFFRKKATTIVNKRSLFYTLVSIGALTLAAGLIIPGAPVLLLSIIGSIVFCSGIGLVYVDSVKNEQLLSLGISKAWEIVVLGLLVVSFSSVFVSINLPSVLLGYLAAGLMFSFAEKQNEIVLVAEEFSEDDNSNEHSNNGSGEGAGGAIVLPGGAS